MFKSLIEKQYHKMNKVFLKNLSSPFSILKTIIDLLFFYLLTSI